MYLIKEKLYDIPIEDINYLVNQIDPIYQELFPNYNKINCNTLRKIPLNHERIFLELNLSGIKNVILKQALDIEPLKMYFGIFTRTKIIPKNWKIQNGKDYYEIKITFNIPVLKEIQKICFDLDLKETVDLKFFKKYLDSKIYKDLISSTSKSKLQLSIVHELTHYLDEYEHSNIMSKVKDKIFSSEINSLEQFFKVKNINNSYYEINAQIHTISILKQKYISYWNKMTIFDIFRKDFFLYGIYREFYEINPELAIDWIKKLQIRMHREGLLGAKMNYIPKNNKDLLENVFGEVCI